MKRPSKACWAGRDADGTPDLKALGPLVDILMDALQGITKEPAIGLGILGLASAYIIATHSKVGNRDEALDYFLGLVTMAVEADPDGHWNANKT